MGLFDRKLMERKTKLIRLQAVENEVCSFCRRKIKKGEWFYREEGVGFHLHSLIARRCCEDCYAKYGEEILMRWK